jgi:hypothetical protein
MAVHIQYLLLRWVLIISSFFYTSVNNCFMPEVPKFLWLALHLNCFMNSVVPSIQINSNKQISHKVKLMNNILF